MSKERELLNKAIELIQIVSMVASIGKVSPDFGSELILEIQELLTQPEEDPFMFKDRESTGSLIAHDAMYKKGYARGFDVAREDYKQKVINAFGVDDEC